MSHPKGIMTPTGAIRGIYTLILISIVFAVLVLLGIGYTNHVQHQAEARAKANLRQSEQVWCGILLLILKTPTVNTAIQIEFRDKLAALATAYGCEGVPTKPPTYTPSFRPRSPYPSISRRSTP